MPTKHSRVSVVKDPDLAHAITMAKQIAGFASYSEAGLVSVLAIRGAKDLLDTSTMTDSRRALIEAGARLANDDLLATSREISEPNRARTSKTDESVTDTLKWVRGER